MFGPVLKGQKVTLRPPDEKDPARFCGAFMENEPSKRALQKAGYRQA